MKEFNTWLTVEYFFEGSANILYVWSFWHWGFTFVLIWLLCRLCCLTWPSSVSLSVRAQWSIRPVQKTGLLRVLDPWCATACLTLRHQPFISAELQLTSSITVAIATVAASGWMCLSCSEVGCSGNVLYFITAEVRGEECGATGGDSTTLKFS